MNGLVLLIPVALGLGMAGLGAFFWTVKSGQYEDLEGDASRILEDDAPAQTAVHANGQNQLLDIKRK